jgi:FMN phosphatase YigB (HAD superfamily)
VVFDVGGVLIRVLPWADAHAEFGLEAARLPDPGPFLPAMSQLNQRYDRGLVTPEEYAAEVCALAGGYSPEHAAGIHSAQLGPEHDGLGEIFDALEAAGIATGLLSNTNVSHWAMLLEEGRYPNLCRAQHKFASFAMNCAKPDEAIFRAFEAATGFGAGDVLFFDDLGRNVAGARAAGWRTELIDASEPTAVQMMAALRKHGVVAR